MRPSKFTPWLDEAAEGSLFDVSAFDIDDVIARRDFFDYDYGLRFTGESIRIKNWSVGFLGESAAEDDVRLTEFFQALSEMGETSIFAIPSKEIGFELTGKHDVTEFFNPPLIASATNDIKSFVRIRSSMIQILRGSFFVFPKSDIASLLCNNGKYKLLAGPRDFVEKIIGTSIEKSWDPVREKNMDPLLVFGMMQAMSAYGIAN